MGLVVGALAWDIEAFYDSISIPLLIHEALLLDYPPRLMFMSLLVHLAPRVVVSGKVQHSSPIIPTISIVAGLFDSTAFAQAFLFRVFNKIRLQYQLVELHSHADDVMQIAAAPSARMVTLRCLCHISSISIQANVCW